MYLFKHQRKGRDKMRYPDIYDTEVVRNIERNKIIVQAALKASAAGKTVLIAVTKIEHGQILEAMLKQFDPDAIFVFGESESKLRQDVLKELDERKRKIVISSTILGEGIDIPCISGSTQVKLLNGTNPTMKELYDTNAENFWVYSSTSEGRIVPGKVQKVSLSGKNVPIIRITLDNNRSFCCTKEHLIMLRNGSFRAAVDLKPNDKLMPLHYVSYTKRRYEMIYNPVQGKYIPTHWMTTEGYYDIVRKTGLVIHHKNFKPWDNSPENLEVMTKEAHDYLHNVVLIERKRDVYKSPEYSKKVSSGVKRAFKTTNLREKLSKAQKISQNKPERKKLQSEKIKDIWKNHPEYFLESHTELWKQGISNSMKQQYADGSRTPPLIKYKDILMKFPTKESFLELYTKYFSIYKVCEILGCSTTTLNKVTKILNLPNLKTIRDTAMKKGEIISPLKGRIRTEAHCKNISLAKKEAISIGKLNMSKQLVAMWKTTKEQHEKYTKITKEMILKFIWDTGHKPSKSSKILEERRLNMAMVNIISPSSRTFDKDFRVSVLNLIQPKYLNHKVLFVEEAGVSDVYDLIFVSPVHNFSLTCGVFVHNSLDTLINAKAAASSVDAFQLIGRVLRKPEGKNKAYVVDIFDQGCRFLESHANDREKIYKTEPRYKMRDVESVDDLTFYDRSW